MKIETFTLAKANGKRTTEVTISEGEKVLAHYRRRSLGPFGHLRLHKNGMIEVSLGRFVNSRAFTLRHAQSN